MEGVRMVRASQQVARKEYECSACLWVKQNPKEAFEFISFADRRLLVTFMRHKNGIISKGDTYERQTHSVDGELSTLCVFPDVDRIARENDLYPQDMN